MLDSDIFKTIVTAAPLVSADLVIVRGSQEVLLGLRNNRPAQDFWFVPGGRIFKNEPIRTALARIAETELGLGAAFTTGEIVPRSLGVFEHFYPDCFAGDIGISTHYVVLGYAVHVPMDCPLPTRDGQHSQLRWWPIEEALASPVVHRFTKDYFLKKDGV